MLETLTTQYIYDLFPIGTIFVFHHYNFRNKNSKTTKESVQPPSPKTHYVSLFNTQAELKMSDNEQSANEMITETQESENQLLSDNPQSEISVEAADNQN